MNTEDLGNSKVLNLLFKPAGILMESRLRKWLMNPVRTLQGAGIQPGQAVLEVGCGTGFFTIPAARMIGEQGRLIAMDVLAKYIDRVSEKVKAADSTLKRFNALYKNISMHRRAINGYNDLVDDMKIKSEEIIHQLNDDPGLVPIKRKVFGKKGRETVLEVIFAYNGRLYYRNKKGNKIEVLAIGTKNTQTKDLEFLNNL